MNLARRLVPTTAAVALVWLVACGGGGTSPTTTTSAPASIASSAAPTTSAPAPSASPSISISASGAASADAYFVPLDGFEYAKAPAAVESQLRTTIGSNPQAKLFLKDFAIRSVTSGGQTAAVVLSITLTPGLAGFPGLRNGFVSGLAGSAGGTPQEKNVEGVDVAVLKGRNGLTFAGWQQGAFLVTAFGQNQTDVLDVTEQLIKANA
jgi:hypothetical protein